MWTIGDNPTNTTVTGSHICELFAFRIKIRQYINVVTEHMPLVATYISHGWDETE
jgi:hypothetical protein